MENESRVEKTSTESKTVTDIKAGSKGSHRRIDTGTIRIETAMNTLRALAAAVTRFGEKDVTTGSVSPSPCFEGRKRRYDDISI